VSLVDRWLSRQRAYTDAATFATTATSLQKSSISTELSVATPLRHPATLKTAATGSPEMSQPVATPSRHEKALDSKGSDALSQLSQLSQEADCEACGEAEETRVVERAETIGTPETGPVEPVLLRDGRRLWRFRADCALQPPAPQAMELIDEARWCGAVLVADGPELIVVERWRSRLPPETRDALRRRAAEVIRAMRRERRPGDDIPV
jgi:hypothetical protein